jgi:dolichol-phosphate mannosyltransferase
VEALFRNLGKNTLSIRKTYVILPAFNEAAALSRLIPNIAQRLTESKNSFEVIVVNDGSSDDTPEVLRSFPAAYATRELRHEINSGYGAALKTALMWVAEIATAEDAVVMMDADNTQDPAYIPQLVSKLEEGYDGVTASYTMDGGHSSGLPWTRRVMSLLLNRLFHMAIPLPGISTYTNGYRGFRVSALQSVHEKYKEHLIEESGFPGGTEFFLKVAGRGGRLTEIPFDLHYEQRGSFSKIRLLATIRKYLHLLITGGPYACS